MEWDVRRKEGFAVSVKEEGLSRLPVTQDRLKMIRGRLSDLRLCLQAIQRLGDTPMYGEALIEYSRALGELEPYSMDKVRFFNG